MWTTGTTLSQGLGQGQLKIGAGLKFQDIKYTKANEWYQSDIELYKELITDLHSRCHLHEFYMKKQYGEDYEEGSFKNFKIELENIIGSWNPEQGAKTQAIGDEVHVEGL